MQLLMVSRWIPPIFTDIYFSKHCLKKQRDYVRFVIWNANMLKSGGRRHWNGAYFFDTYLKLWYVKLVSSTSKEVVERNIL